MGANTATHKQSICVIIFETVTVSQIKLQIPNPHRQFMYHFSHSWRAVFEILRKIAQKGTWHIKFYERLRIFKTLSKYLEVFVVIVWSVSTQNIRLNRDELVPITPG